MPVNHIDILVCCRNEVGRETGRAEKIEIFDCEVFSIEVDMAFSHFYQMKDGKRKQSIRLGRRAYTTYSWTTHVGNICWDRFSVSSETAARIANQVRQWAEKHNASLEVAETSIWDKWESGEPFEAVDFEKFLREMDL
jgi:hypothetical protein